MEGQSRRPQSYSLFGKSEKILIFMTSPALFVRLLNSDRVDRFLCKNLGGYFYVRDK